MPRRDFATAVKGDELKFIEEIRRAGYASLAKTTSGRTLAPRDGARCFLPHPDRERRLMKSAVRSINSGKEAVSENSLGVCDPSPRAPTAVPYPSLDR